jgi:hypothetical protein
MIKVLSRLADRSMLGLWVFISIQLPHLKVLLHADTYFSRDVAREVTHPEWPSRVPRSTNCSAMLAVNEYREN